MSPSDQCRLCSYNFKVKFGNLSQTSYISTENLFNPSQRKDCKGQVLAQICQKVGLEVVKCEKYSSRVRNPCARKIRNLGSLYTSSHSRQLMRSTREDRNHGLVYHLMV